MNAELFRPGFDEGWFIKFKPFFESPDCDAIFRFLREKSSSGTKVFPDSNDLFKAFRETKYEDLKCIIVGQDPYPQPGVADGLAFSCSKTMSCQPSLTNIHKEIERTVYNGMNLTDNVFNPDLTYLARQGVLLLNKSLTVEAGKPNDPGHHGVWDPFMKYLFSEIVDNYDRGIPIVFMGREAQKLHEYLSWSNVVYKTSHPASAAYEKDGKWDCGDVFNKVNQHLQMMNNYSIQW